VLLSTQSCAHIKAIADPVLAPKAWAHAIALIVEELTLQKGITLKGTTF